MREKPLLPNERMAVPKGSATLAVMTAAIADNQVVPNSTLRPMFDKATG